MSDEEQGIDLSGRVAVVTGASAGIGRAYALALAGAGATVVAAARTLGSPDADPPARRTLLEVVGAASGLAGSVRAAVCDVEVEEDVVRTIGSAVSELGRVDVLVNNAALMTGHDPFAITTEVWDRFMAVNVRGPYLAIREVAPHMVRQGSGSIVNITARAGAFTPRGDVASDRTLVYAVSKAALNRLTYFMAEELKPHGIAVNALSPGIVATDTALAVGSRSLARRAKPATPEVLGPALLCLADQRTAGLTGQILHTDDFGTTWP